MFAEDGSGKYTEVPAEGAHLERVQELHRQLIELVAESDDGLMEKYFEEGTLSEADQYTVVLRSRSAGADSGAASARPYGAADCVDLPLFGGPPSTIRSPSRSFSIPGAFTRSEMAA